jgi:hypothetical protein
VVNSCSNPPCAGDRQFTVRHDGSYYIGASGEFGSGVVTSDELQRLKIVADPAAAQTGLQQLNCQPNNTGVSSTLTFTLTMSYADQSSRPLIALTGAGACYYGDPTTDLAVHNALDVLARRYDKPPTASSGASVSPY